MMDGQVGERMGGWVDHGQMSASLLPYVLITENEVQHVSVGQMKERVSACPTPTSSLPPLLQLDRAVCTYGLRPRQRSPGPSPQAPVYSAHSRLSAYHVSHTSEKKPHGPTQRE